MTHRNVTGDSQVNVRPLAHNDGGMYGQIRNREQLAGTLFEAADMPFPPYVTRGVMRLTEDEAVAFLSTLLDIRRLPERNA